jgi:hypothetical protein
VKCTHYRLPDRGGIIASRGDATVAYVTEQVKAALGNLNKYVVRDDQVQTGSAGIPPRTGPIQGSTAGATSNIRRSRDVVR